MGLSFDFLKKGRAITIITHFNLTEEHDTTTAQNEEDMKHLF